MKTLKESSTELEHAHIHISRDKRPQAIMVKDGLVIEAVLLAGGVDISLYDSQSGIPYSDLIVPLAAFDEILEMIIGLDHSGGVTILPPTEKPEGLANEAHT